MTDLKEITFAEKVLSEIQKIRRDLDNLEDVVLSAIGDEGTADPPELRRVEVPFRGKKN